MSEDGREETTTRSVPLWAVHALTKRLVTVGRLERAKILEERAFRKSAIVYGEDAAFFVTTGLLGPRVVKLDAGALDALAGSAVEVACPACEAEMRVANLELPGTLTCVGCGTALDVAEDRSVTRRKRRPGPEPRGEGKRANRRAAADEDRLITAEGVKRLKADFTAIRGIGPKFQTALYRKGIRTYPEFLAAPPGRIAEITGISREQAREYQEGADLRRVNGVGGSYVELLRAVGCWTLWNLAAARAKPLSEKIRLLRKAHAMAGNSVTKAQAQDWITQAKALVG